MNPITPIALLSKFRQSLNCDSMIWLVALLCLQTMSFTQNAKAYQYPAEQSGVVENGLKVAISNAESQNCSTNNLPKRAFSGNGCVQYAMLGWDQELNFKDMMKGIQIHPEGEEPIYNKLQQKFEAGNKLLIEGKIDDASKTFHESLQLSQELLVTHPSSVAGEVGSILAHWFLGNLLLQLGEPIAAAENFGRAVELIETLSSKIPNDENLELLFAILLMDVGNFHASLTDFESAVTKIKESLSILDRLTETYPENTSHKLFQASANGKLGVIYQKTGSFQLASYHLNNGLSLIGEQHEGHAIDTSFLQTRSDLYLKLGDYYSELARSDDALKQYELAKNDVLQILSSDTTGWQYNFLMADVYSRISKTYIVKQDFDKAQENITPAENLIRNAIKTEPDIPFLRHTLWNIQVIQSEILRGNWEFRESLKLQIAASRQLKKLTEEFPEYVDWIVDYVFTLSDIAFKLYLDEDYDDAESVYERVLNLYEESSDILYANIGIIRNYSDVLSEMGQVKVEMGKLSEAFGIYEKRLDFLNSLSTNDQLIVLKFLGFAETHERKGDIYKEQGQLGLSFASFQSMRAAAELGVSLYPENQQLKENLLKANREVSYLNETLNLTDSVTESFLKAVYYHFGVNGTLTTGQLAGMLTNLGLLHQELGNYRDSIDYFNLAKEKWNIVKESNSSESNWKEHYETTVKYLNLSIQEYNDTGNAIANDRVGFRNYELNWPREQVSEESAENLLLEYYGNALILKRDNEPIQAMEHFERALKVVEELSDRNHASVDFKIIHYKLLKNMGDIYLENGDHANAQSSYSSALSVSKEIYSLYRFGNRLIDQEYADVIREVVMTLLALGEMGYKVERQKNSAQNYFAELKSRELFTQDDQKLVDRVSQLPT